MNNELETIKRLRELKKTIRKEIYKNIFNLCSDMEQDKFSIELAQKYNEILQEQIKWYDIELKLSEELRKDYRNDYIEYQQRVEKAIEYIKLGKTFENKEIEMVVEKLQNDLLNILGGDDNERK